MIKIIEKLFAIILICLISYLSVTIYRSISKQNVPPTKGAPYIPFMSSNKKICSQEKVSCDPNDASTCSTVCADPQKMKCVKMNSEYVCLPEAPNIKCNKNNGGEYVWTGYGFTQNKEWACLCTKPEIYGGPHCETKNPSYCSGGILNPEFLYKPLENTCSCPPDKGLVYRINNTPMCVSKNQIDGGGEDGLYGNFFPSPDWRNVFYQFKDKQTWADNIAREFNYGNKEAIYNILSATPPPTPVPTTSTSPTPSTSPASIPLKNYMLTSEIVDKIKNLQGFNSYNKTFDPNYRIVVPYRYFTNTYLAS